MQKNSWLAIVFMFLSRRAHVFLELWFSLFSWRHNHVSISEYSRVLLTCNLLLFALGLPSSLSRAPSLPYPRNSSSDSTSWSLSDKLSFSTSTHKDSVASSPGRLQSDRCNGDLRPIGSDIDLTVNVFEVSVGLQSLSTAVSPVEDLSPPSQLPPSSMGSGGSPFSPSEAPLSSSPEAASWLPSSLLPLSLLQDSSWSVMFLGLVSSSTICPVSKYEGASWPCRSSCSVVTCVRGKKFHTPSSRRHKEHEIVFTSGSLVMLEIIT